MDAKTLDSSQNPKEVDNKSVSQLGGKYLTFFLSEEETEPSPSFGTGCNTDYILGFGKAQERVMILLNIDRVTLASELSHFDEMYSGSEKLTA